MITLIAWRNVWRSKLRSMVVITAVALGLLAGIFMLAFSYGINQSRARDIIETRISHVQIHAPDFKDEMKVSLTVPNGAQIIEQLRQDEKVAAVAGRLVVQGMLSNTRGAHGVMINGIDPESENALTRFAERQIAGKDSFIKKNNGIWVGAALMEKLGYETEDSLGNKDYKLRKKINLSFQRSDGQTQAASFRISGVYRSVNSKLDELNVYVRQDALAALMDTSFAELPVHEIAFLLHEQEVSEDSVYLASLGERFGDVQVENWKDLAPDIKLADESFGITVGILMGIILLALLFGIINTMYMAVMERTRELGMLMSVGMNKGKVFMMIMLETLFLTLIGAPIGMLIAYGLTLYFGSAGIDISAIAEGASSMGVGTMVYTELETAYYFTIAIMVFFTALFAAIFPAIKALSLNPAEAVRAI
ncbi:MAG: FtsX-like permease family protein [Bacteroidota bacterium]